MQQLETMSFNVSEIFLSIQGEGTRAGRPCTFIRLQGCKLRCVWCDTPYALDHRKSERVMSGADIVAEIERLGCRFVEFTGGEPLEQADTFALMSWLCDQGYEVAVETGGHIDVAPVDERVIRIIDLKCPDSKMVTLNYLPNLDHLRPTDEIKFVIASREDYEWARTMIRVQHLSERTAAVLMSCVFGTIEFHTLVEWILEDKLDVRFQLQMHKFVWDPNMRGV